MTNLLVTFTNLCFAATLQSAPAPSGPWSNVATHYSACAEVKSFNVPVNKVAEYFRLCVQDNGVVPTPGKPSALVVTNAVWLDCPMVFTCDDSAMSYYRWFRDGVFLANSLPNRSDIVDHPSTGWHSYQAQAVDGTNTSWMTEATLVETP